MYLISVLITLITLYDKCKMYCERDFTDTCYFHVSLSFPALVLRATGNGNTLSVFDAAQASCQPAASFPPCNSLV